jgi:hypothetical protein
MVVSGDVVSGEVEYGEVKKKIASAGLKREALTHYLSPRGLFVAGLLWLSHPSTPCDRQLGSEG